MPNIHNFRIKQQKEKLAEYLIVFLEDEPVGHIYIPFNVKTYPLIQDLFVKEENRRQGIGKEIINQICKRLCNNGFSEVLIVTRSVLLTLRYDNSGF